MYISANFFALNTTVISSHPLSRNMYLFLLVISTYALASASDAAIPLSGRQSLLCMVEPNTLGDITGYAPCGSNNGYVETGCFCCGESSYDAVACEKGVQTCVTLDGAPFCQDIDNGGDGGGAAAATTIDYAAQTTTSAQDLSSPTTTSADNDDGSAVSTSADNSSPTTTSVDNDNGSAASTTFASSPPGAASRLAFSKVLSGGMILLAAMQG
jgi:hypothetical protein